MHRKIVISTIISLLSYNIGITPTESVHISPRDLSDDARAELQELKEVVQGAIDGGLARMDIVQEEFTEYSARMVRVGESEVQKSYDNFAEDVAAIKARAENASADITYCLNQFGTPLDNLPTTIIEELRACAQSLSDDADYTIQDTKNIIENSMYSIDQYEDQIVACGTGILAILCLNDLISQMNTDMEHIPVLIAASVSSGSSYIENIKIRTQTCSIDALGQMEDQGKSLVSELEKCANDIINQ